MAKRRANEPIEQLSLGAVTYQLKQIRCGKQRCRKCGRAGAGHGPYWYAYSWTARRPGARGRTKATYVGKRLPPDVERARRSR